MCKKLIKILYINSNITQLFLIFSKNIFRTVAGARWSDSRRKSAGYRLLMTTLYMISHFSLALFLTISKLLLLLQYLKRTIGKNFLIADLSLCSHVSVKY